MEKMRLILLWVAMLAHGCGEDDHGGLGATNGGSGTYGNEFCVVSGICVDGMITGSFGAFCSPVTGTCDTGCDAHPRPITNYKGLDKAVALSYLRDALCAQSDVDSDGGGS